MVKDKFGYDHIYSTKSNTVTWEMDVKAAEDDARFYIGSGTNGLSKLANDYWECNDNEQVRLNAQTPKTVNMNNAEGGCNLDFKKAESKGNTGMDDAWRDIEVTGLINLTNFSPSDGRFIIKGPTFHHNSPGPCCSGHAYGCRFFLNGDLQIQFFKEIYHVHYESRPDNPVDTKFGELADGNDHLCKFVRYNKVENNKTVVKLEAYVDFGATGSQFVKVAEVTDAGGWNDDGGQCNGDDDQILTWGSGWCQFRWDASSTDIKFKNWSARHIDPLLVPAPNQPTDPSTGGGSTLTTQRLLIPIVLSFDVNALRTSSCAVGGGGGGGSSLPYYSNGILSPPKESKLSDHATWSNRKRVVAIIADSGSDMYNKIPKTAKFWLRKEGTPAQGNVVAKIWGAGSGTVVKFTCPTVITDASLTASLALVTYDFSTNTYTMKVGDRIGVEYLGVLETHYVVASYVDDTSGNGSSLENYEKSSWDRKSSRELSCELYES